MQPDYIIYCDGGVKHHGTDEAEAYARYMVLVGETVLTTSQITLPDAETNNQSEYHAVTVAVEALLEYIAGMDTQFLKVQVCTDSALVVNQIMGNWKINDTTLFELCAKARSLLSEFKEWEVVKVDRKEIQRKLGC